MKRLAIFFVLLALCLPAMASTQIVVVARGDPLSIPVGNTSGSCWYFATGQTSQPDNLLDVDTIESDNKSFCYLKSSVTSSMQEGKYSFIFEKSVQINEQKILSVGYENKSLVSILAVVKPVGIVGMQPRDIRSAFITMLDATNLNDYEENSVEVQEQYLRIRGMRAISDHVFMASGTSNFATGTKVRIEIEAPEVSSINQKYLVYNATIERDSAMQIEGTWGVNMSLPTEEMEPGKHTIAAYANGMQTTAQFPLYTGDAHSYIPMEEIKFLGNGSIAPITITITIPVPGPKEIIERWHTAIPTPPITDAIGGTIGYPYRRDSQASPEILFGCLAALAILQIIRRK